MRRRASPCHIDRSITQPALDPICLFIIPLPGAPHPAFNLSQWLRGRAEPFGQHRAQDLVILVIFEVPSSQLAVLS